MKRPKNLPFSCFVIVAMLWLASCASDRESNRPAFQKMKKDDSETESGVVGLTDASRKIARTADIRYRVRDVLTALSGLERTVQAFGGAIADSRLENRITQTRTQKYNSDSVVRIQGYEPVATLTVRVPAEKLDTLLIIAAAQAEFIDTRHLAADDATLRYLANEQKNALVNESAPANTAMATSEAFIGHRVEK